MAIEIGPRLTPASRPDTKPASKYAKRHHLPLIDAKAWRAEFDRRLVIRAIEGLRLQLTEACFDLVWDLAVWSSRGITSPDHLTRRKRPLRPPRLSTEAISELTRARMLVNVSTNGRKVLALEPNPARWDPRELRNA